MITVLDDCFPNWWVVTPIRVVTPTFPWRQKMR